MFAVGQWTLQIVVALSLAVPVAACKSSAPKKKKNKDEPAFDQFGNPVSPGAPSGPNGQSISEAGQKNITLNGQTQGSVIRVNDRNLANGGGLRIAVTGMDPAATVIGMVQTQASELSIQGGPGGVTLVGSLPFGLTTPVEVNIVARDRRQCNGQGCDVVPDANGRFPAGFQLNPQSDISARFSIQLADNSTGGLGGLFGGGNNNGGGGSGGFFDRIIQFFRDAVS